MAAPNAGKTTHLSVPGSLIKRLCFFVWYGIISSLWLGFLSFLDESPFFCKLEKFNYEALAKHSNETVVITGGARGIGLEVIKKLLRLDFYIVAGVRNPSVAEKVFDQIRDSGLILGKIKCFHLDLKSLRSVRIFAENVIKNVDRIDILINNAGIMFEPFELTEDGFESHFQVNYLSHFFLTQQLLPKIQSTKRKTDCRIINISSLAHFGSFKQDILDIPNPKVYSAFCAYYGSKLCQVLSTKHLNSKLKAEGANVSCFVLHPGVIPTDLYLSLNFIGRMTQMMKIFFRNIDEGSEVVMFTTISQKLEGKGGSYISNLQCRNPSKISEDLCLQEQLYKLSQDCIKKAM